jgi:hypothetical protein
VGYNIKRIVIADNSGPTPASMTVANVKRLTEDPEELPLGECFLRDMLAVIVKGLPEDVDGDHSIALPSLNWCGDWSGQSWDFFEREVVPAISGEIVALAVWEGGDSMMVLHIKGGKMLTGDLARMLKDPAILARLREMLGKGLG